MPTVFVPEIALKAPIFDRNRFKGAVANLNRLSEDLMSCRANKKIAKFMLVKM